VISLNLVSSYVFRIAASALMAEGRISTNRMTTQPQGDRIGA
jgi:hypothetical protein